MCVVLCPLLIDFLYWVIWVLCIFCRLLPYQVLLLFRHLVVSYSLQPHGLQHSRLLCPSLSPRVCSNSCPLSWWYHPTISSSVIPFSCCLQSFPTGSFPMSCLFAWGDQGIGVSASASVLPMNIQGWFPLGLTGLIFLLSKWLSRVFSSTTVWRHQFFSSQPSLWSNSNICTRLLEKLQLWLYGPLSAKWCICFLICCLLIKINDYLIGLLQMNMKIGLTHLSGSLGWNGVGFQI